jgi:hypothetical protein
VRTGGHRSADAVAKESTIMHSKPALDRMVVASLPLSLYRAYRKQPGNHFEIGMAIRHPLSLFPKQQQSVAGGQQQVYRTYLRLTGSRLTLIPGLVAAESQTAAIDPVVLSHIPDGWQVVNPITGMAIEQATGRLMTLGKLLTRQKVDPKILSRFVNEPSRVNTVEQLTNGQRTIVLSRHPYDILGISFDRGWSSCMRAGAERLNQQSLIGLIRHGSIVCYLLDGRDRNINRPVSRLLIHRYRSEDGNIIYVPEAVYGSAGQLGTVRRAVLSLLHLKHNRKQPAGHYKALIKRTEQLPMVLDFDPRLPEQSYQLYKMDVLELVGSDYERVPTYQQVQRFLAQWPNPEPKDLLAILLSTTRGTGAVGALTDGDPYLIQLILAKLRPYADVDDFIDQAIMNRIKLLRFSSLTDHDVVDWLTREYSIPVAMNPSLPSRNVDQLLLNPKILPYFSSLAANHNLTDSQVERIYQLAVEHYRIGMETRKFYHPDFDRLLQSLSVNPRIPEELLRKLGINQYTVQNPRLPEDLQTTVVLDDRYSEHVSLLALNPGITAKIFDLLMRDPSLHPQLAVNRGLSGQQIKRLVYTENPLVQGLLSGNPRVTDHVVLTKILTASNHSTVFRAFMQRDFALPEPIQRQLALGLISIRYPQLIAESHKAIGYRYKLMALQGDSKTREPGIFQNLDPEARIQDHQVLQVFTQMHQHPTVLWALHRKYSMTPDGRTVRTGLVQNLLDNENTPVELEYQLRRLLGSPPDIKEYDDVQETD